MVISTRSQWDTKDPTVSTKVNVSSTQSAVYVIMESVQDPDQPSLVLTPGGVSGVTIQASPEVFTTAAVLVSMYSHDSTGGVPLRTDFSNAFGDNRIHRNYTQPGGPRKC